MRNKKLAIFILILSLVFAITACAPAQQAEQPAEAPDPAANYPTRPITLIVAFGAGGGTDVGARLLTPLVEAELGQPIQVVNITGAGGWVGWTELSRAEPDGYTIGYINTPALIMGYINPELGRPAGLEMFLPIVNHVWDSTVWAVLPDSPFQTAQDVLDYVKANPGQLSKTTTGAHTQHHINAMELYRQGYEFNVVHTEGAADATAMVLGGHAQILSTGVGEATTLARDGQLRILAIMDEERSQHLPEVPTFAEATEIELVSFSSRGLAAPAGTPQAIVDKLAAAFEKAMNDPTHIEDMEELGLELRYKAPQDYMNFLQEYEQILRETMGW